MSDPTTNPFAASDVAATASAGEMLPLYSEHACMATTFFATSILAAPLLMINAQRTGQNPFVVGGQAALVSAGALLIGMLPLPIPGFVFTLAQMTLVRQIHRAAFETHVKEREHEGVPFAPWTHAALLSLIGFTLSMAFVGLLIWAVGLEGLAEL